MDGERRGKSGDIDLGDGRRKIAGCARAAASNRRLFFFAGSFGCGAFHAAHFTTAVSTTAVDLPALPACIVAHAPACGVRIVLPPARLLFCTLYRQLPAASMDCFRQQRSLAPN